MRPRSLPLVHVAVAKAHPADSRPAVIAMDVIQAIRHIDAGVKVHPIAQDLSKRTCIHTMKDKVVDKNAAQQKGIQHPLTIPKFQRLSVDTKMMGALFWKRHLLFLPHLRSKKVCGVLSAAAKKWV